MASSENSEAGRRRWLIVAGQVAFLPTGMLTTLLWPMLPILSLRWHLSDAQAGNLFPTQFLAQLAGVLLSGVMVARLGFRPTFLSGLLLMAGGVGTLYLWSPWLGMVSVAVYGLGLGLIIPTDNLMIAEVSTGSRAAAVSLLNFFWGVGAVLCSLLVAWAEAHRLLLVLLESVALFLVLLTVAAYNLPFPAARKSTDARIPWREIAQNRVRVLRGPGCGRRHEIARRDGGPELEERAALAGGIRHLIHIDCHVTVVDRMCPFDKRAAVVLRIP